MAASDMDTATKPKNSAVYSQILKSKLSVENGVDMVPESAQTNEGLEKQLLHLLQFSGINQENLHELVGIVAGLQNKGLERIRVFPKGIPPVVDGLNVQATVEASQIAGILNTVLSQTPRLGGVSIFPYGIPFPEVFQVNVTLGNTVEAGNSAETGATA